MIDSIHKYPCSYCVNSILVPYTKEYDYIEPIYLCRLGKDIESEEDEFVCSKFRHWGTTNIARLEEPKYD